MAVFQTTLKELRHSQNMKQEELAALVGVRRETIGKLEHGQYNPSLKLTMDIDHIFHKSVEDIFYFE
ncbi:MAG: helix-turn-helix transcriptional regulator [bacterium]|nr:helix-turn-helix transcriptional regulator [bacterium]